MTMDALVAVLEESRSLGFLGPGPVEPHIEHALGFVDVVAGAGPSTAMDIGAGGGVPGLVLACLCWPDTRWVLLDANQRRTEFLGRAVETLGVSGRARVVRGRAEEAGRDPDLRGTCALVVSRSFGPPAVTAECAAPFLVPEGSLVASEPPDSDAARWAVDGLGILGLGAPMLVHARGATYVAIKANAPCPTTYPRRVGIPAKRPLF